jgi:Tol biopolymer transport system component
MPTTTPSRSRRPPWLPLAAASLIACNPLLGIRPPLPADAAPGPVDAVAAPLDAADAAIAVAVVDAAADAALPDVPPVDAAAPDVTAPPPAADGPPPRPAVSGVLTRVSLSSDGTQADDNTDAVSVSGDGELVAFSSVAGNLVYSDTNQKIDIFLHRRSTGETTRVSLASNNAEANGDCFDPIVTADGKNVVFSSYATNLVGTFPTTGQQIFSRPLADFNLQLRSRFTMDGASAPAASADAGVVVFDTFSGSIDATDTNMQSDVYAAWGGRGRIDRISIGADGVQGNSLSSGAAVSADGMLIAFTSSASNLVPADSNAASDVFVRGLMDKAMARVSVSSAGEQGNGPSGPVAISGDGKRVAFCSSASNLVAGDTNKASDVFVHDLTTHQTVRVSVSSAGVEGNAFSCSPSLSGDGRLVAFSSEASNLVEGDVAFAGDTNYEDVFVHDLATHTTYRLSVPASGARATGRSYRPALSANGRVVVFLSDAPNLVPGDTNGRSDAFAFAFTAAPWM